MIRWTSSWVGKVFSWNLGSHVSGPAIADDLLLERVREREPDAFFVEPRVLRRVLRQDQGVGLLGRHATRRRCYAIEANRAVLFLDRDELGLPSEAEFPPFAILIAWPWSYWHSQATAEDLLLDTWRLLFYGRVLATVKGLSASGFLDASAVRSRVDRIGQAEFDEIRAVLQQEHFVRDNSDIVSCYQEFVALYAEFRHFSPARLAKYFPSLGSTDHIDAVLKADVDLESLKRQCRLAGAPDPDPQGSEPDDEFQDASDHFDPGYEEEADTRVETRWAYRYLVRKAHQAAMQGNHVRAAIRRVQAVRFSPPGRAESTRESARRELERLAQQLGPALALGPAEVSLWRRALSSLAPRAGRGIWSREARLLYDLQKIAIDHRREIYKVGLAEWIRTLGRRPLRRVLPLHRELLAVQHLASARRRLSGIRLPEPDRERLARLLGAALERARQHLRDSFRPIVASTFERSAWVAANLPEQVALQKLTEEVLDRIVGRGFLNMGDFRDAISRSNLKLPDLTNPVQFLRGDRLLQTDRALASALDGVYRRGEVYLRGLQRLSSLAFGTWVGRVATLYLILPLGASYVALKGLDHLIEIVSHWVHGPRIHLYQRTTFLALGLFLVGIVNSNSFRLAFLSSVRGLGRLSRRLIMDLPRWALKHPLLKLILQSRLAWLLGRWVGKPSVFALGTGGLLWLLDVPWIDILLLSGVSFVTSALLLNSRTGRDVEEILADRAVRLWQRFLREWVPGLFRLVIETFDSLLEMLERVLYAVDEWLRFKSGEGPLTLASKAIIGLFWSIVTYVVRIYVVLLIEPQINPIKHFPVVTVSHKLMLPFLPTLLVLLRTPLMPLGRMVAETIAWSTLLLLPGVFGFLVWEFKENWKLYEANRAGHLRPMVIGHHGETLPRLLRPGFHSGTIPKLFGKLRRAEGKAPHNAGSKLRSTRKYREKLQHVEWEIRTFLEREFIALLNQSRAFSEALVTVDKIQLGTNRIRIQFRHAMHPQSSMIVTFEEQSGWLVAGVLEPGWVHQITGEEWRTLRDALAGLYCLSGVNLVREQIESALGPDRPPYDIVEAGLIIWPDSGYRREVLIEPSSSDGPSIGPPFFRHPHITASTEESPFVTNFSPIHWDRWVEVWEVDRAGQGHPIQAAPGFRLLPGGEPTDDSDYNSISHRFSEQT